MPQRPPVASKVISRTQFPHEAFLAKKVGVGFPKGVTRPTGGETRCPIMQVST
jgi:hypothetical protein